MERNKSTAQRTIVVILTAGKGTRMGRSDLAKACYEIDSVPAINRTITTFKKEGFDKFLLVVGAKAGQVIDTVAKDHPDVMYVYQQAQLGTGHAARVAAEALQNIGYADNILVTMADKFIEAVAIEVLLDGYVKQQADMALLAIPKTRGQEARGRIFLDESGQALDIIEKTDRAKQAIVDSLKEQMAKGENLTGRGIIKILNKQIPDGKKQAAAIGELLALAKQKKINKARLAKILESKEYNLEIDGKRYSAEQIEKHCKVINPSLYLFKPDVFYKGVGMLDNDNAQGEYYLTDVVKHLGGLKDAQGKSKLRIRTVKINKPDCVQSFGTPDELLAIQDYVRRQKERRHKTIVTSARPLLKRSQYCTPRQWLSKIENQTPALKRWFERIYGQHEQLFASKIKDLNNVLACYGKRFGFDEKVCIVRAPGRLNLMGRHVDHRGGFVNFLAFNRETIIVAGIREDNNVIAVNAEPKKFKPFQFNISELIGRFAWSDWINFINSNQVRDMLYSTAGHWSNYVKAAVLRLQHQFQDFKINGLNLAVYGDVPIAAGLSSSSTLVVAALQAAIALNNFELTSQQFVDLCGTGEWFVGSRGGAGDHAAIYLGQRGKITQVGYLPFKIEKVIDAPRDYRVIIANSGIQAVKSSTAKHMFNARVTSYNLGFALLKQRCDKIAEIAEYVRDIDPEKLGCSVSDIYRMLLKVPQFMSRRDFRNMLSKQYRKEMETNFATHSEPKNYNVRGVLLFGAAEITRSKMCMDYLQADSMKMFGNLMNISHNGDRVSRADKNGKYTAIEAGCADEYLNKLIADIRSENPEKVLNAQLYMQPGSYYCSTPQIDRMVDIACSVPGVVGAQIAGAGLGGCVMIMAEKNCITTVRRALVKRYYQPNKLKPDIIPCIMVEGAGLAEF